jgi:hypothetical protein
MSNLIESNLRARTLNSMSGAYAANPTQRRYCLQLEDPPA